jgi:hypothetical protein
MADHFYGVNIGAGLSPSGVTFGTVSAGTNFEFRITDGVTGRSKMQATNALKAILAYIEKADAPA